LLEALGVVTGGVQRLRGWDTGAWVLGREDGVEVVATPASQVAIEAARAAAEVSLGPNVLDVVDGWLVSERIYGSHLTALELSRPRVLDDVASMLARWHASTVTMPAASMLDSLRQYVDEVESIDEAIAHAVTWAEGVLTELAEHTTPRVPCHLDVAANVIAAPNGLRLIDFDFAAMAEPAQELGQLLWEAELDERGAVRLLGAYRHATGIEVADSATWCLAAGVTWTVWALSPQRPYMARYARRSWERLQTHWAWGDRVPCG
jgi:thiamine kinase-like enzyme